MLAKDSQFASYLETLAQGADPLKLFRDKFLKDYDVTRQFTQDATIKSAVRINSVLGGMARGYFPREVEENSKESLDGSPPRTWKWRWRRTLFLFFGKRLLRFTEAAIQPNGPARNLQRLQIITGYLVSLSIIVLTFRTDIAIRIISFWAKIISA